MSDLRAPFPYFGGKRRVADVVWQRFGDTANFVEPFAGSLAVLLARPHQPRIETVNDADAMIANFWRALQADPEAVARYADWPVNEVDLHARHRWLVDRRAWVEELIADPGRYDAQVAGWWVWGICQWIGSGWCIGGDRRQLPYVSTGNRGVHSEAVSQTRKLPSLGDAGRGVHRAQQGVRQMRHLSDGGTGVHRTRPHLMSDKGVHAERVRMYPSRQAPLLRGDSGAAGAGIQGSAFDDKTGGIYAYFDALAERLRRVRVCCGDWTRVLGPSVTEKIGTTAIFLDPPYSLDERQVDLYTHDLDVAAATRAWALANGDNPKLRIALCGYETPEYTMPANWTAYHWKAAGGYGSQGTGQARTNAGRETIWFSPFCLGTRTPTLFDMDAAS